PWAIIRGRTETGLSIFRPTPGLDEGPVILQKRVAISPDDTAGSLYFDKIFPLGVSALVEAADLVVSGRATESTQDESRATYEGWVREAEAHINWANHVDFVYDLIRGCNPAPGAWTNFGERKLYLFDARKIAARTIGMVRGRKIGEVVSIGDRGMRILAQGGFVEASDPPNQWQSAVTQSVKLGQPAGFEARGDKDHIRPGDDQLRQALVVADLDANPTAVLLRRRREALLQIAVAGAEQGELAAGGDDVGQASEDEVEAFLRDQAAD